MEVVALILHHMLVIGEQNALEKELSNCKLFCERHIANLHPYFEQIKPSKHS